MQEDGFDAATDCKSRSEKRWMPGLSYDLKFDKTKGENDKIFIDNEITIAVEKKSFLYLAGTVLEFSGGINGKDLFLTIQMQQNMWLWRIILTFYKVKNQNLNLR
jgi:hypothetical protein